MYQTPVLDVFTALKVNNPFQVCYTNILMLVLGNKKDYEVSVYRFGFTRITDRTSRISEVDNG